MEAEKQVEKNLNRLEILKPRIKKRYERYTQLMHERQSRKLSSDFNTHSSELQRRPADPALTDVAEPLEAGENRDLAVRLAQSELSRRATVRRSQEHFRSPSDESNNRRAAGVWGEWENAYSADNRPVDRDLSQRIQDIRSNIDKSQPKAYGQHEQKLTLHEASSAIDSAYKYPTVPRQKALETTAGPAKIAIHDKNAERRAPPILPPKEYIEPSKALFVDGSLGLDPPPRPSKVSPRPSVPDEVRKSDNTAPSKSELDPSSYTFKPSAYLENGTPLRSVFLPASLRSRFLSLAGPNTRSNLETCGILCGTLVSNALFISRLVIPEQISTSDTCETTNESALFEYCDSEDLIMLGWIHTHPTQTCFMSSRDLHTHSGYQVMLPESIAIVCAPSKSPDWGVFRLTDPPGLKTVLNCTQTGLFHPHAEENIYTGALRPGHVFEVNGLQYETVDLRPKKSQS